MIDRRGFLQGGAALSACAAFSQTALSSELFSPAPAWRSFEIVTRLELQESAAASQAWIPLPAFSESDRFKPIASRWTASAGRARIEGVSKYGVKMLHAIFEKGEAPSIELTSRYATRDRAIDLSKPSGATPLSSAERKFYTQGSALIPVDGIVKAKAEQIIGAAASDAAKARAIYEWVVENSYRNPTTRGCGAGDIAAMLKSGDLGGKCADINGLYVGLARSVGLPAREIYGLRIAPSKTGYRSLGPKTEMVTKSQHCRSEVYLSGFGWVPVDPADVRKVMLEEPPGKLPIEDAKVASARKALFGSSEGNWLAYNSGRDVTLPGSSGKTLAFLMYPQAEIEGVRLDCLDPDSFRYSITARELAI